MGCISWNLFEGNINENLVKQIADALVDNGYLALGYEYIILDDLWQKERLNGIFKTKCQY
jgi:alpha-galactosidase